MRSSRTYRLTILLFSMCVLGSFNANGQVQPDSVIKESVYIHCDKYNCPAGDTVWWKGYVLAGNQLLKGSTNLYAELFTAKGKMLGQSLYPVFHGQAIGQFAIADSLPSGVYWLRFFTKYQAALDSVNLPMIPITVFHAQDKDLVLIKKTKDNKTISDSSLVTLNTDTLDIDAGGYNSWSISIKDSTTYHYSCSITDADQVPEADATGENISATSVGNAKPARLQTDTSFLQWQGKAVKQNGKRLGKNNALMMMLVKDSTILTSRVLPVDSAGRFSLDHLFFFGKADILFQLNTTSLDNKNVQLVLDQYKSPAFHIPAEWNKKGIIQLQEKLDKLDAARIAAKGRQLKEVKVIGWKSPRKELDHSYTSGAFSEPALYAFDLRNETHYDLGAYLRSHLPGFTGGYSSSDTPAYLGSKERLLFYVDEQLKTWDQLESDLTDVAYIKALESDFIGNDPFTKWVTGVGGFSLSGGGTFKTPSQPTPMVVSIYTRKGKDVRKVPGLNTIAVNGYAPIAKFHSTDNNRLTLLWEPLVDSNSFRLKFNNNGITQHFRFTLKGFNDEGKEIYYTTIISKEN